MSEDSKEQIALPTLWVDFCKGGDTLILLTTIGTRRDLEKKRMTLVEGMRVHFFQEDANEDNVPGHLHAEGIVHWDAKREQWWANIGPISWKAGPL